MPRSLYLSPFPCLKIRTNNNLTQKKEWHPFGCHSFFMIFASVLGGVVTSIGSSHDANDVVNVGTYSAYLSQNIPSNGGILVVRKGGQYITQFFYDAQTGGSYTRTKWGDSAWKNWQRSDNFGCNTLSDLASALGAGSLIGIQPPTDSFGQSDGDYRDVTVSYGMLLVRNYGSGVTSVYSVADGTSQLIYPSTQDLTFTVSRTDSSHVRITKVGNSSYNALRAKVIDCG